MTTSTCLLKLRDGRNAQMRHIRDADAGVVVDYIQCVSKESDYLSYGPGEFDLTVDEEAAHLRRLYEQDTGFLLGATVGATLVSLCGMQRSNRPRLRHSGELAVSVRRDYWNLGLGRLMCEEAVAEARRAGITRLELRVRADNVFAQRIYRSLGFEIEGVLRGALSVDGKLHDELLMAKLWQDDVSRPWQRMVHDSSGR